jgi:hypothetical protein
MPTNYVVLRQNGSGWVMVTNDGSVSATGPRQAIKQATAGIKAPNGPGASDDRSGTFVAVPVRSWKPERRRIDKVEREVWE